MPPPKQPGESRSECPVSRNEAIGEFGESGGTRDVLINPERPSFAMVVRERSEHSVRAAEDVSIGFDELHRFLEALSRYFRESLCNGRVLKRNILDRITSVLLPTRDPAPTEVAIAVIDHDRLLRRRGNLDDFTHERCFSPRDAHRSRKVGVALPFVFTQDIV